MVLQFMGKHSAQINFHQQEVGSEADKEQHQTGEQHISCHLQLRIRQVKRQFQALALHLGHKLHDCHQDSGNQGDIL